MTIYHDRCAAAVPILGHTYGATQAQNILALDSAYTNGSAGDVVLCRITPPVTATLTTVYFYVTAAAGTPGNLTVELRDDNAGLPTGTQRAVQTVSPGTTANKWITCTFDTPYQVTANTEYWICIADAAGNGTNYATLAYGIGGQSATQYTRFHAYTSTNGGGAVTAAWVASAMVCKFGDGTLVGQPYMAGAADASNALMRGIHIEGLTEKLTISGVYFGAAVTNISGVKVFSGTEGPDDTADVTVTGDAGLGFLCFPTPVTLLKGTVYNIVFTYSSNSTTPGYVTMVDTSTPTDVLACGFGGGTLYRCIDNSSDNTWAVDTKFFPRMALIVQDQVAITGGGNVVIAGGSNSLLA